MAYPDVAKILDERSRVSAKEVASRAISLEPSIPPEELEALERHLATLKLPAAGIDYVKMVAESPPSRSVGSHRNNNMIYNVPLPSFGVVLQSESGSGEYYFLLEMSRRRDVIAIFDQPFAGHLVITNRRGVRTPISYTADYLVVFQDCIKVFEVKRDSELSDLCTQRPNDWTYTDGQYTYVTAVAHLERLGIQHVTVPNSAINVVRGENLRLLAAVRQALDTQPLQRLRRKALEIIESTDGIQIGQVLGRLETSDATVVMQLLDQELIFADLDTVMLARPNTVWVSTLPEVPRLLQQSSTRLQTILGENDSVATTAVSNPKHAHEIALRYALCGCASDIDLGEATGRSARTVRRYRKNLRDAGGDPRSLFPKWGDSGNRTQRKSEAHYAVMHAAIRQSRADPNLTKPASAYVAYLVELDEHFGPGQETPVALSTFYKHTKTIGGAHEDFAARGGNRLANAQADSIDPRKRTLIPTRAFSVAHIDHWNVDLHLVLCYLKGKKITLRPWLTAMVDAYTGEVLGLWLSYRSPSRESCSMVIRDCVRRHGRLPELLVVDGGPEFDSVNFTVALASLRVTRAQRPPSHPRFGKEVERLFGSFKECFARGLPGFVADVSYARKISSSLSGNSRADLQLHELLPVLEAYVFDGYNHGPKPGELRSRREIRAETDTVFPFSGAHLEYNTEFLIQTAIEAPHRSYTLVDGRGIRLYGRWYTSPALMRYRDYKKRLIVRYETLDHSIIYVCIERTWQVCRSSDAILNAATAEHEVLAKTLVHYQQRQLIQEAKLEAARCAYEIKDSSLAKVADRRLEIQTVETAAVPAHAAPPKQVKRIPIEQIKALTLDEAEE